MQDYAAGSTSIVDLIFLQDSTSTTGAGKTGLVFNTAGLTCYYKRSNGTSSVAVSLATITTLGTYASGGFKEIDATNMPGCYEFHPPNAAFASGAKEVTFHFVGANGLVPRPIKYRIKAVDPDNATNYGMSALPATACTGNASLLTSGTGTDQISVTSGRVDAGKISGTTQTARDLGAGVLLSSGTGTGQVLLTSGLVNHNLAQTGLTPRDLGAVADASLTVGDALIAAICAGAGKESQSSTTYLVQTPNTGTTIRTFTLDSATTPTSRS